MKRASQYQYPLIIVHGPGKGWNHYNAQLHCANLKGNKVEINSN